MLVCPNAPTVTALIGLLWSGNSDSHRTLVGLLRERLVEFLGIAGRVPRIAGRVPQSEWVLVITSRHPARCCPILPSKETRSRAVQLREGWLGWSTRW